MDCERLRSGDRACVRFRFIQRPEYITPNARFVFREGRTKGIGIIMVRGSHPYACSLKAPTVPLYWSQETEHQFKESTEALLARGAAAAAAAAKQGGGQGGNS